MPVIESKCRIEVNVETIRGKPMVRVDNDDDSYYAEYFDNWESLNQLIDKLRAAGKKAFVGE